MGRRSPGSSKRSVILVLGFLVVGGGSLVLTRIGGEVETVPVRKPTSHPQLISIHPLPEMEGEMCEWVPVSGEASLLAALQQPGAPRSAIPSDAARADAAKRAPIRTMRDSYSSYSAVAVDAVRNEVVMTDENLFGILVYDRMENTPATARMSEPKRMIRGLKTEIEFQCSLYVDPSNGDIYAVNNDTLGKLVIFSRQARGDVDPDRFINTPHTTFGIAVDEKNQEMLLTVQDDAAVVTYAKGAKEKEPPVRLLQGERTLLADPHGIALDSKRDLLYISNWGTVNVHKAPPGGPTTGTLGRGGGHPNWPIGRNYAVPGSGKVLPPSITVYPRDARGDTPPSRIIRGPKTQLNWPTALALNPETGELFVANDTAHSVLVFGPDAMGDVAPIRVLQGPRTLLKNPTGVFYDQKNGELWVANFGNHTATVYKPTAAGDTLPLRVIRSGPLHAPSPMLGNPHVVTYDSKREEILVAN
ncbi:MAG: hypothetical protein HYX72_03945 [Acidobacteria bacterium]|nr:hypothetical protein [Acidobacteriota bacterium]